MIPHPIRLRHPWDELPGTVPGRVLYRRRFKCPSGLDSWERVALEIDRTIFSGEITLNGQTIGRLESGQFFSADITQFLQPANELRAEVDPQTASPKPTPSASVYIVDPNEPPGSPIGEVRLVIRAMHPSDRNNEHRNANDR
jgi:hypothetical protein